MTTVNEMLADTLEALSGQVEADRMNALVNQSAWLALVRHLSAQGLVTLTTLERDLRTLGETSQHADWQAGHAGYADAVRLLDELPSAAPR